MTLLGGILQLLPDLQTRGGQERGSKGVFISRKARHLPSPKLESVKL